MFRSVFTRACDTKVVLEVARGGREAFGQHGQSPSRNRRDPVGQCKRVPSLRRREHAGGRRDAVGEPGAEALGEWKALFLYGF